MIELIGRSSWDAEIEKFMIAIFTKSKDFLID